MCLCQISGNTYFRQNAEEVGTMITLLSSPVARCNFKPNWVLINIADTKIKWRPRQLLFFENPKITQKYSERKHCSWSITHSTRETERWDKERVYEASLSGWRADKGSDNSYLRPCWCATREHTNTEQKNTGKMTKNWIRYKEKWCPHVARLWITKNATVYTRDGVCFPVTVAKV
jgi:hypothetical protein